MCSVKILINSFAKVRRFHQLISLFDGDFDLLQDRYVVNAKSQLGIFSLDISRPIRLHIHSDENLNQILESISAYLIPARKD